MKKAPLIPVISLDLPRPQPGRSACPQTSCASTAHQPAGSWPPRRMRTGANFDGVYVTQWAECQKSGGGGGRSGGGVRWGWQWRGGGRGVEPAPRTTLVVKGRQRPFLPHVCYSCTRDLYARSPVVPRRRKVGRLWASRATQNKHFSLSGCSR